MKNLIFTIVFTLSCLQVFPQEKENKIELSEFNLSNNTSPAFVLINESPTEVYVPENLKALTIHTLNNFDGSLSLELSPYYFINTKSMGRTFLKYVGIQKIENEYKQNPFSGLNTTTISFAYANKEFENFVDDKRKVFSFGLRTKILRFYNKEDVAKYYNNISDILSKITYPQQILLNLAAAGSDQDKKTTIINDYLKSDDAKKKMLDKELEKLELYKKPIKPIFQFDGAIGYSSLFKENNVNSETVNRFGAWVTSEFSLILNKDSNSSKSNNYLNAFIVTRYVEDGFNLNDNRLIYRDFGGKVELEFGNVTFGYEYIKRNGSIKSERSIGNIKYLINKNLSLNGGFGKDFNSEENLVTLFGINWGINIDN
tara:strand:- start:2814 stop:3926 length:1113 start_codon:yes stop_codon:yes gene_type:complete